MAAKSGNEGPVRVDITNEMRKQFREDAAGALARRSTAWLHGQFLAMAQWILIGSIGLMGLYVWFWSPIGLLILFLAGLFSGMAADAVKWLLIRKRLQRAYDDLNKDRLVWAIVTAMKAGRTQIPASAMHYVNPGMAIMVDLYAAVFAAGLFYLGLRHLGVDLIESLRTETGIHWALLAVVVLPWASVIESLVRRSGGQDDAAGFQAGGRGGGLFVVVIAFLFLAERPSAIHSLMVFINAGTVLVALLAAFGLVLMSGERRWLKEHLPDIESGTGAFGKSAERTGKRGKQWVISRPGSVLRQDP
ncbi:MAG: hypothetical protein IPK97_14095 [Ahniella sp.]|nr:hypothetical protein [Ahniella sp.]